MSTTREGEIKRAYSNYSCTGCGNAIEYRESHLVANAGRWHVKCPPIIARSTSGNAEVILDHLKRDRIKTWGLEGALAYRWAKTSNGLLMAAETYLNPSTAVTVVFRHGLDFPIIDRNWFFSTS